MQLGRGKQRGPRLSLHKDYDPGPPYSPGDRLCAAGAPGRAAEPSRGAEPSTLTPREPGQMEILRLGGREKDGKGSR